MERALIYDIQHTEKESFPEGETEYYLNQVLDMNVPLMIALTPYQRDMWRHLENSIGKVVEREGSGILLEGLLHVCSLRNHKIRDPHHEGICTSLFGKRNLSYERQLERISEGKEFLEKIYGKGSVDGFVPPQHLLNRDIVGAVGNAGMKYLVTNAMLDNLFPYAEDDGVIVVPSGSVKHRRINNPVVHVYYDWINWRRNEMKKIFGEGVVPLSKIPVRNESWRHGLSENYLFGAKQVRDIGRLKKWLSDKEFRRRPSAEQIRRNRKTVYEMHREELFG